MLKRLPFGVRRITSLFVAFLFAFLLLPLPLPFVYGVGAVVVLYALSHFSRADPVPATHPLAIAANEMAVKAGVEPIDLHLLRTRKGKKTNSAVSVGVSALPFKRTRLMLSESALSLSEKHFQAIVAHEIGHIKANDILDQIVFLPAFFGAIYLGQYLSSDLIDYSSTFSLQGDSYVEMAVYPLFLQIFSLFFTVLPLIMVLALYYAHSRRSELAADAYATSLVPALSFLSALSAASLPSALSEHPAPWMLPFTTHPSFDKRAAVLAPKNDQEYFNKIDILKKKRLQSLDITSENPDTENLNT